MKRLVTQGIVLSRTNFAEADRILTILTSNQGKLRLIAKGSRKIKSKLAGGIELFGVNDLTFIEGKSEIKTLISSRLKHHYGRIIKDIDRTMYGYELLKMINKITEDSADESYFDLLETALQALDDKAIDLDAINLWLSMRLLKLTGQAPNLKTDGQGKPLQVEQKFNFDYDTMSFEPLPRGHYTAQHIKLLRLASQTDNPQLLSQLQNVKTAISQAAQLARQLLAQQLGV